MENLYNVGDTFTGFDSYRMRHIDIASLFEALPNGMGYIFVVYLLDIQKTEEELISEANIGVSIYKGSKGFVHPVVNIGDEMVFEMNFDPTMYDDDRALQLIQNNNELNIVLVESSTMEIKAIRQTRFPLNLANVLGRHWEAANSIEDFKAKQERWYQSFKFKYDEVALWNISKHKIYNLI